MQIIKYSSHHLNLAPQWTKLCRTVMGICSNRVPTRGLYYHSASWGQFSLIHENDLSSLPEVRPGGFNKGSLKRRKVLEVCVLPNVWAKTLVTKEQNCWLNQWVEKKKTKPPKVNKRSQMPWMSCTHKRQKFHGSVEGWGQTLHQTHLAKCCFVHKLIWTGEFNYSIFLLEENIIQPPSLHAGLFNKLQIFRWKTCQLSHDDGRLTIAHH